MYGKRTVANPYAKSYIYFIDDIPFANWAHPCRYVFVDAATGNYTIKEERMIPENWDADFTSIAQMQRPSPKNIAVNRGSQKATTVAATPNDNLYAVLINGDDTEKYWNNISAIYCTLIEVYGYKKENIFVHYDMGTSELQNGNDLDNPNDNSNDIDYPAYKYEIERTFRNLSGEWKGDPEHNDPAVPTLTPDDQLFIFTTDHGDVDTDGYYILLQNSEDKHLYTHDFASYIEKIACSQIITLMTQCHSGAFVFDYMDFEEYDVACTNRLFHAPTHFWQLSWPECWITGGAYDEFVYYWIAAVRGAYPNGNIPWETYNDYPIGSFPFNDFFEGTGYTHPGDYNPDLNEDGFIQMHEAFSYADDMDMWTPIYAYKHFEIKEWEEADETPLVEFTNILNTSILTLGGVAGVANVNSDISVNENYTLVNDLIIGNDAEITIADGVTLTISPTAKLIFNGGSITGTGTLNINGNMHINANKIATLKCNINLSGNIFGDAGSTLSLSQSSSTRGTINVAGNRGISNIGNIDINNYNVNMQSASSGLTIANCPNVYIYNSSFSGIGGHKGLVLNQCHDSKVVYCSFSSAFMGLQILNSNRVEGYGIDASGNNIGAFAYNSQYYFDNCDFEYNDFIGLWAEDITASSYIYNSRFNDNGEAGPYVVYEYGGPIGGIEYQGGLVCSGYQTGYMTVTNTEFYYNKPCAINLKENYLTMSCVNIYGNGNEYGVLLNPGMIESSNSNFENNQFAFYGFPNTTLGNQLDIFNGENDFSNNGVCVYGEFAFIGDIYNRANTQNLAFDNVWIVPGQGPLAGRDYVGPSVIYDSYPLYSISQQCGQVLPTQKSGSNEPSNTNDSLTLQEQLKLYYELFSQLKSEDNESAYFQMKQLMSDLNYKIHDHDSTLTIAKMLLHVQRKMFKEDSYTKNEFVNLCLDASKTLSYLERYNKAITLLDSAKSLLPLKKQYRLDRAICKINAKKEYAASNGELDILDLLATCSTGGSHKMGELSNVNDPEYTINEVELTVSPNPVTGISYINLCVGDKYLASEIKVYDSSGKLVLSQFVESNTSIIEISNATLTEGVYLIGVYNDGKVIANQKMVVVK